MQGKVAVESGHYRLEEGAKCGGAGDAFAVRLQEDGVCCIELQDGFELLSVKVLDQASRILASVTRVDSCGAAMAVERKVAARIVAKARNVIAAKLERRNCADLAEGVAGTFMAAPIRTSERANRRQ